MLKNKLSKLFSLLFVAIISQKCCVFIAVFILKWAASAVYKTGPSPGLWRHRKKARNFQGTPFVLIWSLKQVSSVFALTSTAYRYPVIAAVINWGEQVKARICWLCLHVRMCCVSCSTFSCKNLQLWTESMCLENTEIESPSKLNTFKLDRFTNG